MTTADRSHPDTHLQSEDIRLDSKLVPDTFEGSLIHRFLGSKEPHVRFSIIAKAYVASIAITYFPMLLVAGLGSIPLRAVSDAVHLPFLLDWNIAFAFLVSFPMLVILIITDENVLSNSLRRVHKERVIRIPDAELTKLAAIWSAKFRSLNFYTQIGGLVLGVVFGVLTLWAQMKWSAGTWISSGNQLQAVSYVYLLSITMLYTVIVIFVVRCIYISRFLSAVVDRATIFMQPFHPDKCGGLRPVGKLGLRNQYTVTILGLNVIIYFAISYAYLPHRANQFYVVIGAIVAYLILGPAVFLGPLLPFHHSMRREKEKAMSEVVERLRTESERMREQLRTGRITTSDETLIDRLRKIGASIDRIPVWPFDARTLRKFVGAYIIPALAALLGQAVSKLSDWYFPLP